MTLYEELMNKHYACIEKAKNTTGYMQSIWLSHAYKLEQQARALEVKA